MLLALDEPAQALAEFERSLQRDPNRFRGIYGAARAAQAAGNLKVAARLLRETARAGGRPRHR